MKKNKSLILSGGRYSFLLMIAGVSMLLLMLSSCQAVFTYSPLSFLQRDPSTLSEAERVAYAEDALSSGDTTAMQKAYDSLKALLADNPDDPTLNELAAKLAVELSGVPTLVEGIISGEIDITGTTASQDIANFLSGSGVDPSYMEEAADYYVAADTGGADLNSTDYVMGSIGLLIKAADEASGNTGDYSTIEDPSTWNSTARSTATDALNFLNEGISGLSADDPSKAILQNFSDFISDYTI